MSEISRAFPTGQAEKHSTNQCSLISDDGGFEAG